MKKVIRKTRNLEKSRQEILNVAFREVYTNGFQGVSIDEIIKKTHFTKGAFYHHFPTKMDLGYALVNEIITPLIIERWIDPLKDFDNPLEGILSQLKKLIGDCPPEHLKFGCPLNNLVQEMAPIDIGFKKRLKAALILWIEKLMEHLERGKRAGYLRQEISTREVAHFVVMTHEGFYGIIKGIGSESVYEGLINSIKVYFRAISHETSFPAKAFQ